MMTATEIVVKETKILMSPFVVFSAWEPYDGHGTSMTIDGKNYGRVGTSRIPAVIDALPARSNERSDAYRLWKNEEYKRAYDAIIESRPGILDNVNVRMDMGEIEIW